KKKNKKEVIKRNKTGNYIIIDIYIIIVVIIYNIYIYIEKTSLELIQDFYFPTAASKIKMSEDGLTIMATGIYPPMIKVYQTDDLSLKFKRHLDADIIQFEVCINIYLLPIHFIFI